MSKSFIKPSEMLFALRDGYYEGTQFFHVYVLMYKQWVHGLIFSMTEANSFRYQPSS